MKRLIRVTYFATKPAGDELSYMKNGAYTHFSTEESRSIRSLLTEVSEPES